MYSEIINPHNGEPENINSLIGKQILSKYLHILNVLGHGNVTQHGGSATKQISDELTDEDIEERIIEALPSDVICPITRAILVDPVITSDGFTYERSAILRWFRDGRVTSPMTNIVLDNTDITPNLPLREMLTAYMSENGLTEYWERQKVAEAEAVRTASGGVGQQILENSRNRLFDAQADHALWDRMVRTRGLAATPLVPRQIVSEVRRILEGGDFFERDDSSWLANQPPRTWPDTPTTIRNRDELCLNWIKWRLLDPAPETRRHFVMPTLDLVGTLDHYINSGSPESLQTLVPPEYLDILHDEIEQTNQRIRRYRVDDDSRADALASAEIRMTPGLVDGGWGDMEERIAQSIDRLDLRLLRENPDPVKYKSLISAVFESVSDELFTAFRDHPVADVIHYILPIGWAKTFMIHPDSTPLMLQDGDPADDVIPEIPPWRREWEAGRLTPIDGDFEIANRDFINLMNRYDQEHDAATAAAGNGRFGDRIQQDDWVLRRHHELENLIEERRERRARAAELERELAEIDAKFDRGREEAAAKLERELAEIDDRVGRLDAGQEADASCTIS